MALSYSEKIHRIGNNLAIALGFAQLITTQDGPKAELIKQLNESLKQSSKIFNELRKDEIID